MAGAGFDAEMLKEADGGLKDAVGRVAYLWTGAKQLRATPVKTKIKVDGTTWFDDVSSCVLVGNVGGVFGGVDLFDGAEPDDGLLELGVVTADGLTDWARTLARTALGSSAKSPFVQVTRAKKIRITFGEKVLYELDGGDRDEVEKLKIGIEPGAITICVPARKSRCLAEARHREPSVWLQPDTRSPFALPVQEPSLHRADHAAAALGDARQLHEPMRDRLVGA